MNEPPNQSTGWPTYSPHDAFEDGQCAKDNGTPLEPNPFHDSVLARAFEAGWKSRVR